MKGKQHAFAVDAMEHVHNAYLQYFSHGGSDTLEIDSGDARRKLGFWSMQQTNLETGQQPDIFLKLHVPETWSKPQALLTNTNRRLRRMYVLEDDQERLKLVARLIRASSHMNFAGHQNSPCFAMNQAQIKGIWRTANSPLWKEYVHRARRLQGTSPGTEAQQSIGVLSADLQQSAVEFMSGSEHKFESANDRWLFHGTSWANANDIAMDGFDCRLSSKRGMYGQCTYFASQLCQAHQYTCESHQRGRRCPVER